MATENRIESVTSLQTETQRSFTGLSRRGYDHRLMVLLFFALFFFVRLYNLRLAGMYWDEPLYLYWGQMIGADWNMRFMGAEYLSRQPMHTWLLALSGLIIADPIVAGRTVSVIAGTFTMAAVWLLAKRLFSTRVAVLSVLLYTIVPYTLHFDRTALTDSLLCAENIWLFYLSVRLLDHLDALSMGGVSFSFAMALLTKSYGRAFPLLLPLILFYKDRNEITPRLVTRWVSRLALSLVGGFVIYYLVFGSTPYAALIDGGDVGPLGFVMSPAMLATFPWYKWQGNLLQVLQWFIELATIPISIVGLAAMILSPRLGGRAVSVSLVVFLPIAGSILIANVFYERYILYAIPFFLILTAVLLDRIYEYLKTKPWVEHRQVFSLPLSGVLGIAGFILLLLPSIISDYFVLTDFDTANRFGTGFYGVNSASDYLADQAKDHLVCVIAIDLSRPAGDGLAVLLRNVPNIEFFRVKPYFEGSGLLMISNPSNGMLIPKDYFAEKDVYYVFEAGLHEENWLYGRIDLVHSFPNRRGDDSAIGLYRIQFDDSFR